MTSAAQSRTQRIRSQFEKFGCAQLRDAASAYTHVPAVELVMRTPGQRVAGPAFPIITDNDMLPCLQALDAASPDEVLYIHNRSAQSEALAGDILVTAAKQKGLGGLVVDGAVRDLSGLTELGFPVFSRSVNFVSAKTAKVPAVSLPMRITIPTRANDTPDGRGEFSLERGDWIFGDADGALLIKKQHVTGVFTGAQVLYTRECELKEALQKGHSLAELCGLRDYLSGTGPLKFDV